jgi:hypothetical protein
VFNSSPINQPTAEAVKVVVHKLNALSITISNAKAKDLLRRESERLGEVREELRH